MAKKRKKKREGDTYLMTPPFEKRTHQWWQEVVRAAEAKDSKAATEEQER